MSTVSLTRFDAIALGAVILIGAGAYQFGFRPLAQAKAEARATNAAITDRLAALEKAQADLKAEKARIAGLQQRAATTLKFESVSTLNRRMGTIPELGERAGVRIREVVPKAGVPGDRLVRIPITIAGEGPSHALSRLLTTLHAEFPDMEVITFSALARPDNPAEPVRFSVELCWYALSGSAASTAAQTSHPAQAP